MHSMKYHTVAKKNNKIYARDIFREQKQAVESKLYSNTYFVIPFFYKKKKYTCRQKMHSV